MLGRSTAGKGSSLMGEYSLKLGEAVLRSRTRQAEQQARLETEIAAKIKSEFISNMSHELRTPLNTVIGFSKLLAEHNDRPLSKDDIVEYARLIHDAAGNLLAIINDILDMSKIQGGLYRLDLADVSIDEELEAVVLGLRKTASTAGVKVALDLPPETLVVRGDVKKLRQALSSLVGNAVKFTASGGSVTIAAALERDGGVTVSIQDTGIGMDEEELRVAIAPFGQVDGKRTRWREGTGLGLPIAKALIEMHGGTLALKSTKSVGTECTIRLPSPQFVAAVQQGIAGRGHLGRPTGPA
jgi:two-component system cell cycle sensor histidine kinase PleC